MQWVRAIAIGLMLASLSGCASREVVLELRGSILYDKPEIRSVSHSIVDGRREGGTVVVTVDVDGDPGLAATFDITPGIAEARPLKETAAGRYSGQFSFPPGRTGGPFTIIGRLRHDRAGEVTLKDNDPISISLIN